MPQNQQQPPTKHHIQDSAAPTSTTVSSTSSNPPSINPCIGINIRLTSFTRISVRLPHTCLRSLIHINCQQCPNTWLANSPSQLGGPAIGSSLHVLPTSPAKFCDECGAPYLREISKFCSDVLSRD